MPTQPWRTTSHRCAWTCRRASLSEGARSLGNQQIQPDYNIHFWCKQAGLEPSSVTSMTSHLVDQGSSLVRLEFLTEMQRNTFNQHCKGVKCEWNINYQKCKMRAEPDITSSDRIAQQPFHALLGIFREILPRNEKGRNGEFDADVNALQIYPFHTAASSLLSQASYVLDSRFPRRYVCLIFTIGKYLEEVQQKWLEAFSKKMRSCLNIIPALSRAAQDPATTTRFHHSKSLDVNNILQPAQHSISSYLHDHDWRFGQTSFRPSSTSPSRSISAELNRVLATSQIEYGSSSRSSRSRSYNKGKGKGARKGKRAVKDRQHQTYQQGDRNRDYYQQSQRRYYTDRSPDQTKYGRNWDDHNDPTGPPPPQPFVPLPPPLSHFSTTATNSHTQSQHLLTDSFSHSIHRSPQRQVSTHHSTHNFHCTLPTVLLPKRSQFSLPGL